MAGTAAAGRSHGPTMLERPQLERRLDEAFGKRLTLVVAGAGIGKTTLLASWASDLDAVWYQVRETDRAVVSLARGILAALGRRVSGLPEELSAALEAGGGASDAERERARRPSQGSCVTRSRSSSPTTSCSSSTTCTSWIRQAHLPAFSAADLLESTGGWPAAVRLALEALRESGPDGRARHGQASPTTRRTGLCLSRGGGVRA